MVKGLSIRVLMSILVLGIFVCASVHHNQPQAATVTIAASPTSIAAGSSTTLTVGAANALSVQITGSDGSSYKLPAIGGTQTVSPAATTTYTATATGSGVSSAAAASARS